MSVVWSRSAPVQVSEVHDGLPSSARGAYNTVKTTMERLAEKGILSRVKVGRAYLYSPSVTRDDLERRIVSNALDRLVQEFPSAVASFFVTPDAGMSHEKLALLLEAIERRRSDPDA